MRVFKTLIIGIMALTITVSSKAQSKEGKKKAKLERLSTDLMLSENQQQEAELIFKEAQKNRKAVKENTLLSESDKKAQLKELRKKTDLRFTEILDSEQRANFSKMKTEKRASKGQRKDRMAKELELTDDQKLAMKKVKEEAKATRKAVQQDESLTSEEKKASMKEIRNSSDKQISEILSKEQYTKLKAIKAEKKEAKRMK